MSIPSWWDQEGRTEKLRELYSEELSARQIARIMGCTRNSVIGKVNRLKLNFQTDKVKIRNVGGPVKSKKSAPLPIQPVQPALIVDGEKLTEETISRGMCRYPYGDPSTLDFHYCGHPVKQNSKYCAPHHAACCTPNVKKNVAG